MSTTIAHEPIKVIRRREKAAELLDNLFASRGLNVTRATHYRSEPVDRWIWNAITEDILELIDRGKLS